MGDRLVYESKKSKVFRRQEDGSGTVDALFRLAGHRVGLVEDRRREVEGELVVALELCGNPRREVGFRIEARDFVFTRYSP